jgi:AbrB family looped-hinge helix DNA binding protein
MSIILNIIMPLLPLVVIMEIVTIDNSGRLVIPEFIRKKLHLTKDVPLLITELDDDKILIKKLDRDEIEKKLREELKGSDIDEIAREVRSEVNEAANKKYAAILD